MGPESDQQLVLLSLGYYDHNDFVTGALRVGAVREPSYHPSTLAFEHLSLYIQKHFSLHPLPLHLFHKVDQTIRGTTCICDAVF